MEIFKLFEASIADIQHGHVNIKELRRDQLLDRYDEAVKTFHRLVEAKESEIAYRRNLLEMLDKSKVVQDNKLAQTKQAYLVAKKHAPPTLDLKRSEKSKIKIEPTETPSSSSISPSTTTTPTQANPSVPSSQQSFRSSDLDIPLPVEINENRTSLDRRLSEFLKTFPNLTQAGLTQPTSENVAKPSPGYYTQQPPPPQQVSGPVPPHMAMLRYPPPNMIPPVPMHPNMNPVSQENHEVSDMELSEFEETSNNGAAPGGTIPMVASAMQQGAGGKQHLRLDSQQPTYAGPQFNNAVQYAARINPLPFDPSIMEPRLRDSPSSRDKHTHGERTSHRHSSGSSSSGSGIKHGSDKTKYSSSSHSSGRSKRH